MVRSPDQDDALPFTCDECFRVTHWATDEANPHCPFCAGEVPEPDDPDLQGPADG